MSSSRTRKRCLCPASDAATPLKTHFLGSSTPAACVRSDAEGPEAARRQQSHTLRPGTVGETNSAKERQRYCLECSVNPPSSTNHRQVELAWTKDGSSMRARSKKKVSWAKVGVAENRQAPAKPPSSGGRLLQSLSPRLVAEKDITVGHRLHLNRLQRRV